MRLSSKKCNLLYTRTELGENLFQSIIVYLFTKTNFNQQMVTKMVQDMEGYMQGKIKNTYDRILAEGFEKGANEKIFVTTNNMLKEGFDISTIARLLNVPEKEIIQIIAEIENH